MGTVHELPVQTPQPDPSGLRLSTSALIGEIYESIRNPDNWQNILQGIALLTHSKSAVLLYQDNEIENANTYASFGLEEKWIRLYNSTYGIQDPTLAMMAEVPVGQITASHLSKATESIHTLDIYKEFYQPQDIYHLAGGWLIKNEKCSALIGFQRGHDTPAYEDEILNSVAELVPHLQRALHMHQEFIKLKMQNKSVYACLDSLKQAIVLLDQQAQVTYYNRAAETILKHHPAIKLSNDFIAATDPEDNVQLKKGIMQVVQGNRGGQINADFAIGLRHPDTYIPLPVKISPISQNKLLSTTAADCISAIMVMADPDQTIQTTPEMLSTVYHLTHTEAKIALNLANGFTAEDIAQEHQVLISTVRSQIKLIRFKMNVTRQVDLIRILLKGSL